MSNYFTQGGQTQLHQLRMLRQVVLTTISVSLLVGLTWFIWSIAQAYSAQEINLLLLHYSCKVELLNYLLDPAACHTLLHHPGYTQWLAKIVASLQQQVWQALEISGIVMVMVSSFWIWRGRKREQPRTLKGVTLATPYQLRHLVKQQETSPIHLANIPLPKGAECEHLMITGTTGTGKSNALNHLLTQIRTLNQKAVIVDVTGELVERFYDPTKDHILNPLDERSRHWSLWQECEEQTDFDELAASLISNNSSEQFWVTSARQLLSTAAFKLKSSSTITKLLDLLLRLPIIKTAKFLEGTEVSAYVSLESEKTTLSIRATLAASIKCLSLLEDQTPDFTIKQCLQEEADSWMFLTARPFQRESLKPLLSAWLSLAVKALLSLAPDPNRRIWFIIDELAALNKLPILLSALAESRKYGGCFALGFQDLSQLDAIYGVHTTRSICSLTNTKLIFRVNDHAIAYRLSQLLGEEEIMEITESISFGAHQMRDGVSLASHRRTKPLISPSDIMSLNNLEAYLKLAGSFPITKVQFSYLEAKATQ